MEGGTAPRRDMETEMEIETVATGAWREAEAVETTKMEL